MHARTHADTHSQTGVGSRTDALANTHRFGHIVPSETPPQPAPTPHRGPDATAIRAARDAAAAKAAAESKKRAEAAHAAAKIKSAQARAEW